MSASDSDRTDLIRLGEAIESVGLAFRAVAVETLDLDGLRVAGRFTSKFGAMLDGFRADLARRARDLKTDDADRKPHDALDPDRQRPQGHTDKDSDRADLFDKLPDLGDSTRDGEIPGDYADVINQQIKGLSKPEQAEFLGGHRQRLQQRAKSMGLHHFRVWVRGLVDDFCAASAVERLDRQRRNRRGRLWTDPISGMTKLFAELDPETGARVKAAIDQEVDRIYRAKRDDPNDSRSHAQVLADAIANLTCGAQAGGRPATELVVLVDLQSLVTDHTDHNDRTPADTACDAPPTATAPERSDRPVRVRDGGRCCETSDGTRLPIETIRRLACDAGLVPAVLNGDGVVLNLGRSQRLASKSQRLALQVMYPHCAFDGCSTPFDRCEIHHVDPWGPPANGTTNLDKLVPVCQQHHHLIHDHHLDLSLDPDTRTLTVRHPDGTVDTHPLPTRRRRTDADPGDHHHDHLDLRKSA